MCRTRPARYFTDTDVAFRVSTDSCEEEKPCLNPDDFPLVSARLPAWTDLVASVKLSRQRAEMASAAHRRWTDCPGERTGILERERVKQHALGFGFNALLVRPRDEQVVVRAQWFSEMCDIDLIAIRDRKDQWDRKRMRGGYTYNNVRCLITGEMAM
ncbi:hypothetical protein HPB50_021786 [Hyalomma asiaticum]|uniref:Uncharacterized protein n=1 Tax=Hyalomma asiaticum TaxID=266040 RepID=A0ACB7S8G6_HYAAI|nr:hypothetical protein HPB50_021786 [Hyalomma asiaticum]